MDAPQRPRHPPRARAARRHRRDLRVAPRTSPADAGALCLKSGNAAILRGGSESFESSAAIHSCLAHGLKEAGLPEAAVQRVATRDRAAVGEMLTMTDYIDVVVPRGGKSLVARVAEESRVPVIKHLDGICHVYIDRAADGRDGRVGHPEREDAAHGDLRGAETVLVHRDAVSGALPGVLEALIAAGCEVRGDETVQEADPRAVAATPEDWDTEYLDAIVSVKAVDSLDEAIAHVEAHGSHHTDSIVTEDGAAAERFLREVDSGIVLHNASTQFADGGEFGMGAEIGISTGKLHGPRPPWAWSSSRATNTSCAAPGRPAPDRPRRIRTGGTAMNRHPVSFHGVAAALVVPLFAAFAAAAEAPLDLLRLPPGFLHRPLRRGCAQRPGDGARRPRRAVRRLAQRRKGLCAGGRGRRRARR